MNFSLIATKINSGEIISTFSTNNANFDVFYIVDYENVSIDIQHAELTNTSRELDLENFMQFLNKISRSGEKIAIELILNELSIVTFNVKTFLYSVDYNCKVAILDSGKISNRKMAGIDPNSLVDGWNESCIFYKDLNSSEEID